MSGVNLEKSNFHQVVDDDDAMFMTDLVKGYEEIHVFVEHPVHEPLKIPVEDFEPLATRLPGSEVEGVDAKTLGVFVSDREYAEYGDEEYRPNFSQFGGHDNAEFTNVDHGEPHEVGAEQIGRAHV